MTGRQGETDAEATAALADLITPMAVRTAASCASRIISTSDQRAPKSSPPSSLSTQGP